MADVKPKSLFQKLHAIMADVSNIEKKGKNAHFNYEYVRDEEVVREFHKAFVKHRVLFMPSVTDVQHDAATKLTHIRFTADLVDVDNGNDREVIEGAATGHDTTDKGIYKAMTGGIKYLLLKTFLVSTGDDPEQDHGAPPAHRPAPAPVITAGRVAPQPGTPITPKQKMGLAWRLKKAGKPAPKAEWLDALTSAQASRLIEQFDKQAAPGGDNTESTPDDVEDPLVLAADVFGTPPTPTEEN